ncbi:hypothetical protein LMK08_16520 [Metapseudomonas furukawaii]|uniref:hypothetical protein n=1 Tax=Metapseudomonas furukawaii TaxID=1149133 RepID=UPI00227A3D74|nr:hypothetical protein [Pseudomonas furukawaii]WAG76979.1 hypothetical protein LMK08_16520 [Pseudomonas furukawaii]
MGETTDLGERLPHVVVQTEGAAHVIPATLLRDVIAGRTEASILTEPVLRRIMEEWLQFTQANQG